MAIEYIGEGKIFNGVVTSNGSVHTSDEVKVYNPNRRVGNTSVNLYSTKAGTATIEVKMEQGTTWYVLTSGITIPATTLVSTVLTQLVYAVRVVYTNGATAGVLNGWIYSA